MVQRTLIRPPQSRLGPLSPEERRDVIKNSPVYGQYDKTLDRESAYEILSKRSKEKARAEAEQRQREDEEKERLRNSRARGRPRRSSRQTVGEAAVKSITRSIATSLGRALVRGILGSLKRGF